MASIGYKKKGDNGPLYNPERDYAYITPTLMRIAIENLDAAIQTGNTDNISSDEIVRVATCLADAQRDFVNAVDPVESFEKALRRHGFYDFRSCVQRLLFASIGEIFCAAWFSAVREVSLVGEESPAGEDMARFTAVVREFASKNKQSWYNADHMAEHLRMLNDVLQARVNELGHQLVTTQNRVRELERAAQERELCQQKKPQTFVEYIRAEYEKMKGQKKCPSTGCTRTRHSSGPS
ncbi:hypothetical protein EBZ39_04510 [bacterium]|nr:hypothetical protein [bacterium]